MSIVTIKIDTSLLEGCYDDIRDVRSTLHAIDHDLAKTVGLRQGIQGSLHQYFYPHENRREYCNLDGITHTTVTNV